MHDIETTRGKASTMTYLLEADPENGFVNAETVREKGRELEAQYQSANPYPHVVIDDFLPPDVLNRCLSEFPAKSVAGGEQFNRDQERLKESFHPDSLTPDLRRLFYSFNSRPFIRVIENITGISGLIGDPYYLGAGFHEIRNGGHLSVHADFNHHKPLNLERRVNVLIYLNQDWQDSYGGQLELWDNDMTKAVQTVVPLFNRCVIFNTTSNSMHGNPRPVNHPLGLSRRSIALYYYTSTWDSNKKSHTTQFQVRHGSADKFDWKVRIQEVATDLLPPAAARGFRSLKRQFAKHS